MPVEVTYEPLEEFVGISEDQLNGLPTVEVSPDDVFELEKSDFLPGEPIEIEINPYFDIPNPEINEESPPEPVSFLGVRLAYIKHRALFARDPRAYLFSFLSKNVLAAQTEKGLLISVEITDPSGKKGTIRPIVDESGDKLKISVPLSNKSAVKPGAYQVKVRMLVGSTIVESTETFTWGVLGLNVRRSFMTPNEPAYFQMAALNEYGHTLCDVNLKLEITNESGFSGEFSTQQGTIVRQPTCGDSTGNVNNYTDQPDFTATFIPEEEGEYTATLTNLDNGYSISDILISKTNVNYVIERFGATSLAPFLGLPYEMKISIEAKEAFDGEVVETVPASFEIVQSADFRTRPSRTGDTEIYWPVSLGVGSTTELTYLYKGPHISPMLFFLGPVKFIKSQSRAVQFADARKWRLAYDAACVTEVTTGDWNNDASWTDATCGASHYPNEGGQSDSAIIADVATITLTSTETVTGFTMCESACT